MRRIALGLALALISSTASAQCSGVFAAGTVCGTVAGGPPKSTAFSAFGGITSLTGDVIGTGPGAAATTLTTAQPGAHTWAATQTFTVAPVFTDQSGSRSALGLGTAATQNTGTSGATLPFANGANTWAATQTFTLAPVFTDQSGSRTALGLGTSATVNTGTSGATIPLLNGGNTYSGSANFTSTFQINGNTQTFPAAAATIPRTVASGAKALATGAIGSAACTSAQTDTATGTLTTDAIIVSFNGDPTAVTGYVPLTTGMLTIIYYPTADTVNFKVCNNTTASITPGAVTINWRVIR